MRYANITLGLAVLVAGCSDATGAGGERVALRFASTGAAAAGVAFDHTGSGDVLTLTGTNGTLRIEDIRLIVSEFELEQEEGACEAAGDDDDCEEFEGGPFLVDLPLAGGAVTLTTEAVPAGTYSELELEVEDLEFDDDEDAAERQAIQALLAQLRQTYPAFPSRASMVAHGTFTPTGSSAREPFTVYFDAEIEVELDLVPPVTVPGTSSLTVQVNPGSWFRSGTQVVNLAALNGRTLEFELEIERGFHGVDDD